MLEKYQVWIKEYIERTPHLLGRCHEASAEMRAAFPELQEKKGYVETLAWGEREHVWLVDEEGNTLDPTEGQFPHGGLGLPRVGARRSHSRGQVHGVWGSNLALC